MTRLSNRSIDQAHRMADLAASIAVRLPQFAAKAEEYTRGGLPRDSTPEAISGSSSAPLPARDRTDMALDRDVRSVMSVITEAWADFQRLDRILNSWLLVSPPPPDDVPCANLQCTNDLEAGRESGECGRCRVHRHRYHVAYPLVPDGEKVG